jgi:regulator of nonsense transcripts 3
MALSEAVRAATWEDAKGTFTNPSLIGPPVVEFSVYKKIPSNRKRTDARQGTIDQDPEFMAFLEGLANPAAPKEGGETEEGEDAEKIETKVTTTPLVEYLKEKKANKGKESGKGSKASGTKGKGGSKDDEPSAKKKGKNVKEEKTEKTPKETVKILTKKAALEQAAEGAKNAAAQLAANASAVATSTGSATATATDGPKSRRAGIAAAARILQRDLGLSPGSAHRRARQDAAKADAESKGSTAAAVPAEPAVTTTDRPASPAPSDAGSQTNKATASKTASRRTRGGRGSEKTKGSEAASHSTPTAANPPILLKKGEIEPSLAALSPKDAPEADAATTNTSATTTTKANAKGAGKQNSQGSQKKQQQQQQQQQQQPPTTVTPGATKAFVKHANASQGVTEALIRQTLTATYGEVTAVDHDKRKGFAYVDFAQHESLARAIAAGPVTIGQASVQIVERKDKKPAGKPQDHKEQQQQATGASASTPAASENGDKEKNSSSGRSRRGRGRGGGGANSNKNASGDKAQPGSSATANGGSAAG